MPGKYCGEGNLPGFHAGKNGVCETDLRASNPSKGRGTTSHVPTRTKLQGVILLQHI